ncbi:endospore germination permease [Paenibacillus sp. GCM10027627]|uniref:GerAB/ArcD/ProY family transporter n=1 Tax=unclassified Paenibacillus TaxID=185978 RepID=UPI0036458B3C
MAVPRSQQLSFRQFVLYIYKTQIGIGILTLPRDLADLAGTDGWLSLIIGWLVTLTASFLIIQIMKKNPDMTLYDLLPHLFGKWMGKSISLVWIGYTGLTAGYILFSSIFIIQTWIMRNTSHIILIAAFLLPIYMIARSRFQVQGRYAEFVYISTIWMPPFLLFSLNEAHLLNLLPILKEGIMPILKAVRVTLTSFLGFELVFFLYPFLKDKSKAFSGVVIASSLSLFLYLVVVFISFAYFSEGELHFYLWPTLQLLKSVALPFVERFEIVFLAFYLLILSQSVIPYLYFSSVGISHWTGLNDHTRPLIGLVALYIIASFFIEPTFENLTMGANWYSQAAVFLGMLFPVLLLAYMSTVNAFKRGRRS